MQPAITVLMPTYRQAAFLPRALYSLLRQRHKSWECMILDDGSPDQTEEMVKPFLADERIRYWRFAENRGMAAVLNIGLDSARGRMIAYLPSDDVWYQDHLESLYQILESHPRAVLAYSGIRYQYDRVSPGQIEGYPLQLVQVLHRRTNLRWIERDQLVTDDLDRLFWNPLRREGPSVALDRVTCEWVDSPTQRHKLIREPLGGVNPYRRYHGVSAPLRFHSSVGNLIDERELYRSFRERPDTPPSPDALKIVLVGELAYNPERVLALEERGHKLYGLWLPEPHSYNTVGPLPFGHVEEIPVSSWREEVRRIKPDLFYGLLNWQAVPWAHFVMNAMPDIPFVWHFKEGPFICLNRGTWPQLIDLYLHSAGQIYCSPEMRDWFRTVAPECFDEGRPHLILDGDLPKRDWFTINRSPRLSDRDGSIHTVVAGRPIGLHPPLVAELAANGVHLHFYGESTHALWREWIQECLRLAPRHLHLHPNIDQRKWVTEFSQYDAGWLHFFESLNQGEIARSTWDDLNYPARLGPIVAAGLPLLQRDNTGSSVATQSLVREHDIGIFFTSMEELAALLRDRTRTDAIRSNVWSKRDMFTFDAHADRLIDFFRQVADSRTAPRRSSLNSELRYAIREPDAHWIQ
jgi:Glycosyltransferases involved in cell wall biogenesis